VSQAGPTAAVASPGAAVGRRRRLSGWDLGVLVAANAVAVIGLWWRQRGIAEIHDAAGLLTSLGRVTGMLGALLALVQLLLIARIPVLDAVALDRVNGWHRRNGTACLVLLAAHAALIAAGYALDDRVSLAREAGRLLGGYSGVALATIGLVLLIAAGATSARAVRRRLGRRAWHALHLTVYAGVALGFSHQLATGHEFQRQPVARAYWWALYGATLAAIVGLRLVAPAVRSLVVHRLRVERVAAGDGGLVTVTIGGRRLDRLGARAGQYAHWRFLAPGQWWRERALSFARAPDASGFELAARAPALAALTPGTRVIAEGPAGGLTAAARRRSRVALIAAGPGLGPVRALLEDMAGEVVVVCVAAGRPVPFAADLEALARRRGSALHVVDALDAEALRALVPDVAERDVFVCGPSEMVDAARAALRAAGVPPRQVASEAFG
jgi:ferredoxin-NADP reductase/DMSO/TMAO reductase YedYZ heme-binding membrane subunit